MTDTPAVEEGDALPIDMVLFCPNCGLQHIDEPDERTPDWTNPPHRSHLCHDCGCIWRPADVPTNGVGAIQTQGKADTWAPERGNAERALVAGDALREAREALELINRRASPNPERTLGDCADELMWIADEARAALAKLDTAEKGDGE